MSWNVSFNKGISSFQAAYYEDALQHFNQAIEQGGDQQYIIYDSRAAIYEKLGMPKDALRDAKKVIKVAPNQWQGYARAARLFLLAQKLDASLTMVDMALERLKARDAQRRDGLSNIKEEILAAQLIARERQRRVQEHFKKLPVELAVEIFKLIINEDPPKLLIVLQVCQHWRNIIWHAPSLWDTLILSSRYPSRKAAQWVSRSKGSIRELRVRQGACVSLDWPVRPLRDVKWNRLRVCKLESWDLMEYLKSISMSHILMDLTILEVSDSKPGHPPHRDLLLCECSKMQSLVMTRINFSWGVIKNLTSLVVRSCDFNGNLSLALEANPLLEKFILVASSQPLQISEQTFLMSELTHLELEGIFTAGLLEHLVLPKLQILHIKHGAKTLDLALSNIIGGGLSSLRELCINSYPVTAPALITLLRQSPLLERLEVSYLSDTVNQVVEALASPLLHPQTVPPTEISESTIGLICPSLTYLNVSHSPDIKTGPLVRLIKSRLPENNLSPPPTHNIKQILSLQADSCPHIDADWIPWFRTNLQSFSCIYFSKKTAAWKR